MPQMGSMGICGVAGRAWTCTSNATTAMQSPATTSVRPWPMPMAWTSQTWQRGTNRHARPTTVNGQRHHRSMHLYSCVPSLALLNGWITACSTSVSGGPSLEGSVARAAQHLVVQSLAHAVVYQDLKPDIVHPFGVKLTRETRVPLQGAVSSRTGANAVT